MMTFIALVQGGVTDSPDGNCETPSPDDGATVGLPMTKTSHEPEEHRPQKPVRIILPREVCITPEETAKLLHRAIIGHLGGVFSWRAPPRVRCSRRDGRPARSDNEGGSACLLANHSTRQSRRLLPCITTTPLARMGRRSSPSIGGSASASIAVSVRSVRSWTVRRPARRPADWEEGLALLLLRTASMAQRPVTYRSSCSIMNSLCSIRCFTTSPMLTMPTTSPSSRTGKCRVRFSVINAMHSSLVVSGDT